MEAVRPTRNPIRRSFSPGVCLEYMASPNELTLGAKINSVQVREREYKCSWKDDNFFQCPSNLSSQEVNEKSTFTSNHGLVIQLRVASCCVSYDGQESNPGISSNIHIPMLGILWWKRIKSRGSSNISSYFMLGILWRTNIPSRG